MPVSHGRIVKRGPKRPHIDGATLIPMSAESAYGHSAEKSAASRGAGACAQRRDLPENKVKPESVRIASTLSLLRVRARDVRARYERLWRCVANNKVQPFVIDIPSIEGDGSESERANNLMDYIRAHSQVSDQYLRTIQVNRDAAHR